MDSDRIIAIIKRKKNELEESITGVGPDSDAETLAAAAEVGEKARLLDEILEEIASADMQGVREGMQPDQQPEKLLRR
jgi:hypothetical protein